MASAAIKAAYADFKHIKTRKVLQIVLEVPAEQAEAALAMLGFPVAGSERWVAIALLNDPARPAAPKRGLSQDAYLLCNNPQFKDYAAGRGFADARELVLRHCGITSRAELDTNHQAADKYRQLVELFNEWQSY